MEDIWDIDQKKVFTQAIKRIQEEKDLSLGGCCRLFGISRQSLYQARRRAARQVKELAEVRTLVKEVRMEMPQKTAFEFRNENT